MSIIPGIKMIHRYFSQHLFGDTEQRKKVLCHNSKQTALSKPEMDIAI